MSVSVHMRAEVRDPTTGRWSLVGKVWDQPSDSDWVEASREVVAGLSDGQLLEALHFHDRHQLVDPDLPEGTSSSWSAAEGVAHERAIDGGYFYEPRVPYRLAYRAEGERREVFGLVDPAPPADARSVTVTPKSEGERPVVVPVQDIIELWQEDALWHWLSPAARDAVRAHQAREAADRERLEEERARSRGTEGWDYEKHKALEFRFRRERRQAVHLDPSVRDEIRRKVADYRAESGQRVDLHLERAEGDPPFKTDTLIFQNYRLSTILGGYSGLYGITPISELRDLPDDASDETKEALDHVTPYWLTLAELKARDRRVYQAVVYPETYRAMRELREAARSEGRDPRTVRPHDIGAHDSATSSVEWDSAWEEDQAAEGNLEIVSEAEYEAVLENRSGEVDERRIARLKELEDAYSLFVRVSYTRPGREDVGRDWDRVVEALEPLRPAGGTDEDVRMVFLFF